MQSKEFKLLDHDLRENALGVMRYFSEGVYLSLSLSREQKRSEDRPRNVRAAAAAQYLNARVCFVCRRFAFLVLSFVGIQSGC
jgi:hypothetical protein